ncbi:MAG: B12-binding domain-containing radical SAM protein, partial [Planctomycetes bacterium]|nr:B12-binding domain-containing radical SAM protein [Planctomycetota bacterium]
MSYRILLVNPPIYDFAAYDFWLKPYGMLSAAGRLRGNANFKLFDYMDRLHPFVANQKQFGGTGLQPVKNTAKMAVP